MSDSFAAPGGFTPPGGEPRDDGSRASADATPATQPGGATPAPSRGERAGATQPAHRPAGGRDTTTARKAGPAMAIAAWTGIAAGVALLIGISWSVALDWQGASLEPADPGATGDLAATALVPGMCLETVGDDGAVGTATVVDCASAHEAEVISEVTFPEARFPGDEAVAERSLEACATRMDGVGPAGSTWTAWVPTADSWQRDDKRALCILVLDAPTEGRVGPDAGGSTGKDPVDGQDV
ncbi:septum formation family protein [Demequina sp. NBRC 110056]|uniref:septum formation family protein n=1 Tax=Demequina sp. NBRC 110056 TaxID=1570345 RepID=UPI000A0190B3|nr:septum formation family protein [Demequina sp. NBRC 110056]